MYEDETPEAIKARILWNMASDVSKIEGSYTDSMTGPISVELSKVYGSMNAIIPIAYIDETSGGYIDKRCAEIGMFRKAGKAATVTLSFTGSDGTVIPAGSIFLTTNGLEFSTQTDVTITGGAASATAIAVTVGAAYNMAAGSIISQYNSIAGLTTVTNPAAAQGGADPETDADLVARYYYFKRNPPTSGNVHDYERWALEVDGVGGVRVTPLENGPGTVGVLIVGPKKQPVDQAIVSVCTAHIETCRPVGPAVTVASASALTISVSASVTIDGSTTKDTVKMAFASAVNAYLESISFVTYTVLYNHIAYLLMGVDGVTDFSGLTVNGGSANITVGNKEVPVLGAVEVN